MKVLLTGATGFLGNNLLRALLQDGHQVTALIRQTADPRPLHGLEFESTYADLLDLTDVSRAVDGVDLVIHSAALIQMGWSKMEQSHKVNVEATQVLAQASRRKNIRMIHVSTVDTLESGTLDQPADESRVSTSKPPCSYVVSKTKAEQAFLAEVDRGLDGVVVNPGFMVGPYDWKPSSGAMMLAISNRFLYFVPAGGCSVVDVRDVAEGILSAVEHGKTGERYILAGENMSYLDLWCLMTRVMKRPPPKKKLPSWLANTAGSAADFAGKLMRREFAVNSASIAMGQQLHYYSSEKAKRELGYRIGSVETALEDAWNWFKTYEYV